MGYATAAGFANEVQEGNIDIAAALAYHLTANHFPPVPLSMVPVAIAAIEAGEDIDYRRMIDLPEGVLYKDEPQAPAWSIIESLHLSAFME